MEEYKRQRLKEMIIEQYELRYPLIPVGRYILQDIEAAEKRLEDPSSELSEEQEEFLSSMVSVAKELVAY